GRRARRVRDGRDRHLSRPFHRTASLHLPLDARRRRRLQPLPVPQQPRRRLRRKHFHTATPRERARRDTLLQARLHLPTRPARAAGHGPLQLHRRPARHPLDRRRTLLNSEAARAHAELLLLPQQRTLRPERAHTPLQPTPALIWSHALTLR